MPAPLVERVNRDVNVALRELTDKLAAIRLEPMPGTTADAARFIADETALWSRVIEEAHITPK